MILATSSYKQSGAAFNNRQTIKGCLNEFKGM